VSERTLGPTVAGRWYPAERRELERQVEGLLESGTEAGGSGIPHALIAPHAGFLFSGSVAASAFRLLRGGCLAQRVIVIGPSHFVAFEGAAVPQATRYDTPLGAIPIDAESCDLLRRNAAFRSTDAPFRPEHGLEAELPFLQRALPSSWQLLPVLVGGGCSANGLDAVAEALAPLWDAATLLVISSDFTHFGRNFGYVPFSNGVPQRIEALDMGAVERIRAIDADGFADYVARTGATICGQGPIRILLRLAAGRASATLAAYDTSGRISGNWEHSVSYASLAFRATADGGTT